EPVGHCYRRDDRARQRVSDLQVVLAASHLACVSPWGRRVKGTRIVGPLAHLMSQNRSVLVIRAKEASGVEQCWRVSLKIGFDGVIPAEAAIVEIARITSRQCHIIEFKDGEGAGIDPLCRQSGHYYVGNERIEKVDVNQAKRSAQAENIRRN